MQPLKLPKEAFETCEHCNGKGKNPKKRTQPCPCCSGKGTNGKCIKCGKGWMAQVYPNGFGEVKDPDRCYCYAISIPNYP